MINYFYPYELRIKLLWGLAAAGGPYAAIAALVNIPAIIFGAYMYEIFLTDSDRGAFLKINCFLLLKAQFLTFFEHCLSDWYSCDLCATRVPQVFTKPCKGGTSWKRYSQRYFFE